MADNYWALTLCLPGTSGFTWRRINTSLNSHSHNTSDTFSFSRWRLWGAKRQNTMPKVIEQNLVKPGYNSRVLNPGLQNVLICCFPQEFMEIRLTETTIVKYLQSHNIYKSWKYLEKVENQQRLHHKYTDCSLKVLDISIVLVSKTLQTWAKY